MKQTSLICILSLLLLSACGVNPDKPVYDTVVNPDKFPTETVELLDWIQANDTIPADSISNAFAGMYENNFALLGNRQWLAVVRKLGVKFRARGERLASGGLDNFKAAGDYFRLATFAKPDDQKIAHLHRMFATWRDLDRVATDVMEGSKFGLGTNLNDRIKILGQFILIDSAHLAFSHEYLARPLLEEFLGRKQTAAKIMNGLAVAERAFLASLGYSGAEFDSVLAKFDQLPVELIAYNRSTIGPDSVAIELYLRLNDKMSGSSALFMERKVSELANRDQLIEAGLGRLSITSMIDLTGWKPGRVYSISARIKTNNQPIAVSLFVGDSIDETAIDSLSDLSGTLWELPVFSE